MATIKSDYFTGGAGQAPVGSDANPPLQLVLRDIADDLTELRAKFVATLAKLDLDTGVNDTDYAAVGTPAALKTIKG